MRYGTVLTGIHLQCELCHIAQGNIRFGRCGGFRREGGYKIRRRIGRGVGGVFIYREEVGECTLVACIFSALLELQPIPQ